MPVQRFRAVLGALMLSTQGGDIDNIVEAERMAILRVFGVAAGSRRPVDAAGRDHRQPGAPARRRRRARSPRHSTRDEIPGFLRRQDEIGNLSVALREMTNALYTRIEAIESFAADVATN